MLGKIADGLSLCKDHISAVQRFFPHDHFQDRGFSCAVDPYKRRLFTLLNMERTVMNNDMLAE